MSLPLQRTRWRDNDELQSDIQVSAVDLILDAGSLCNELNYSVTLLLLSLLHFAYHGVIDLILYLRLLNGTCRCDC